MDSVAMSSHLPALMEPHEREAVGHDLEATLHDLVSLSLIGKQLHWAVVGQLFQPLHLQLDELARTRMNRLGEIDVASQDVLVGVVRKLEEQQWMLRAQLTGRS